MASELEIPLKPSPWGQVWEWVRKYVLAPIPILVIAVVAILLIVLGAKDIQVGGLISKLLGKKASKQAVDVANTIPEDRVDSQGNRILPGTPDSKGMTQAVVVPIEPPGVFSNPDVVKVVPPGEAKPVEVKLPDGVKAKDVDKVVVIKPDVYAVTVRDTSKVPAKRIDDLLERYGK